jgi:hypothetical protein
VAGETGSWRRGSFLTPLLYGAVGLAVVAAAIAAAALAPWSGAKMVQDLLYTHGVAALIAVLLTYLCGHPIFAFCYRGWNIKREDVLSSLGPAARALYMRTFRLRGPETHPARDAVFADVTRDFEAMYLWRYGRYRLVLPILLLTVVVAALTFALAETAVGFVYEYPHGVRHVVNHMHHPMPLIGLPAMAAASIAGAYAFVVFGLIQDSARYNMPPGTILGAALRLIVATPLGYAMAQVASHDIGVFIAFALGAFPLKTVALILKRVANKKLDLDIGSDSGVDQVKVLDGVDSSTADRLETADILTVAQLAYCDPVQVSLRTNIAFDVVLDYVSQALAWVYLGSRMKDLRVMGLRGALEIRNLLWDLGEIVGDDAFPPPNALAQPDGKPPAGAKTLTTPDEAFACALDAVNIRAGRAAKLDKAGLERAFREIALDPRVKFLAAVWAYNAASAQGDGAPAADGALPEPAWYRRLMRLKPRRE